MTRLVRTAFVFALLLLARPATAQGWSTAPLRSATPTPRDGLPPDRAAFHAWLRERKDALDPQQLRVARERMYMYVSGEAKVRGGTLPAPGDTTAISPFVLAAGLGDPGAMLISAQWSGAKGPFELARAGVRVRYETPYLSAGSVDDAWRVCYPFFFMTEPIGIDTPPGGVSAETVILSTLVAPDKGPLGASAARIFIAAAQPGDSARLIADFSARLRLTPMGPTETPGAWFHGPDNAPSQTVAVARRLPKRVVLLIYTGARGTFEVNRTHFETVVARLGTGPCPP